MGSWLSNQDYKLFWISNPRGDNMKPGNQKIENENRLSIAFLMEFYANESYFNGPQQGQKIFR